MNTSKPIDIITKGALFDDYKKTLINESLHDKLDENSEKLVNEILAGRRIAISLTERPVTLDNYINDDNITDIRLTSGQFGVLFRPPGWKRQYCNLPFVVRNDILGFPLKVSGAKHFRALAEYIPEVKWMIDNTGYDDRLFDIAKQNEGTIIPFCVDMVKYLDKIKDNSIESTISGDKMIEQYGFKNTYGRTVLGSIDYKRDIVMKLMQED